MLVSKKPKTNKQKTNVILNGAKRNEESSKLSTRSLPTGQDDKKAKNKKTTSNNLDSSPMVQNDEANSQQLTANSSVVDRSDTNFIHFHGVRTHNLKNIDVSLPKNKITTITGVSGSGKSSFAFDTLYKE
jgi:ABC-type glutathione transport system ATPase component